MPTPLDRFISGNHIKVLFETEKGVDLHVHEDDLSTFLAIFYKAVTKVVPIITWKYEHERDGRDRKKSYRLRLEKNGDTELVFENKEEIEKFKTKKTRNSSQNGKVVKKQYTVKKKGTAKEARELGKEIDSIGELVRLFEYFEPEGVAKKVRYVLDASKFFDLFAEDKKIQKIRGQYASCLREIHLDVVEVPSAHVAGQQMVRLEIDFDATVDSIFEHVKSFPIDKVVNTLADRFKCNNEYGARDDGLPTSSCDEFTGATHDFIVWNSHS